MFDYEKIRNEVEDYLCGCADDYDILAIMAELREYTVDDDYYIRSIDDVDPDDFNEILIMCEK